MTRSVPVAANLLETKLGKFSARRLGESMALPLGPCAVVHTLNFPLIITFPLFVVGLLIGGTIFVKTPPGQRPLVWTRAIIQHQFGSNTYSWTHPGVSDNDFAEGVPQDDWITRAAPPHASRIHEASAAADGGFHSPRDARRSDDPAVGMRNDEHSEGDHAR